MRKLLILALFASAALTSRQSFAFDLQCVGDGIYGGLYFDMQVEHDTIQVKKVYGPEFARYDDATKNFAGLTFKKASQYASATGPMYVYEDQGAVPSPYSLVLMEKLALGRATNPSLAYVRNDSPADFQKVPFYCQAPR